MVLRYSNSMTLRLLLLFLLNSVDATFTILALHRGIATEANPVMAVLYDLNPLSFVIVKLLSVWGFGFVLWRFRATRLASVGLDLLIAIYSALCAYHAIGLM